jgi:hypothetical protein
MSGSKIGPTFAFTNCFARGDAASDDGYRRLPFRVATRLAAVSFEMLYQIAFAVAIGVLVIGGIASLWLFRRWRVLRDRWVGQIEANESPENFAKQHRRFRGVVYHSGRGNSRYHALWKSSRALGVSRARADVVDRPVGRTRRCLQWSYRANFVRLKTQIALRSEHDVLRVFRRRMTIEMPAIRGLFVVDDQNEVAQTNGEVEAVFLGKGRYGSDCRCIERSQFNAAYFAMRVPAAERLGCIGDRLGVDLLVGTYLAIL